MTKLATEQIMNEVIAKGSGRGNESGHPGHDRSYS